MSETVNFDLASQDVAASPEFWEAMRRIRAAGPVTWIEHPGEAPNYWAVTGYAEVLEVLQDWETYSSAEGVAHNRPSFEQLPVLVPLEYNPPRQRTFRKQVNPYLTIRSMAGLEASIRAIADEFIDTFVDAGTCDIAVEFARKLPGTVFFRLIAHASDEDFKLLEPYARAISFENDNLPRFIAASTFVRDWAGRELAARQGRIDVDDVVSALNHLDDNELGEVFPQAERNSALQAMINGGIGTSASAIGEIVLALCADPELQERVMADPQLIPDVVEEVLRLEAPVTIMFRTASHDVQLGSRDIKGGDKVAVFLGAANRDPDAFERPDELVLDRDQRRHLAFGAGPHRCIGSNLARLQVRVAVEQIVARLAPFRLPEGATIEYLSRQSRGPVSIPLEFSLARA